MTPLRVEPVLSDESTMFVTASLIVGTSAVVVVDAGFTSDQGRAVGDRVAATGLPLMAVVITHQHPDHYFGAAALLERWPKARLLADPQVVAGIQATGKHKLAEWRPALGDRLPTKLLIPEPFEWDQSELDAEGLQLDGEEIQLLPVSQGDCAEISLVYVPSASTLITGDVAYSGTHVWLVETDATARAAWRENLRGLSLPYGGTVIAGHIRPGAALTADVLAQTEAYIADFDEALSRAKSVEDVVSFVTSRHPDRALPQMLQLSARAQFGKE